MSYVNVKGINCYYEVEGNGEPVILLHGWGQNTIMMKHIQSHLKKSYTVYNFDFPNFGKSEELKEVWGCEEYAQWLREVAVLLKIENPIIIAHSFGCRIAFHYAKNFKVKKMVLTGAAGIKRELDFKAKIKLNIYKNIKKLLLSLKMNNLLVKLQNKVGSEDYKNTTGFLRDSFVKIVNDDVRNFIDKIAVETLLVYGEKDEATRVVEGRIIEKTMPNATLVIFENDDHYAYFNQYQRFNRVLDAFLGGLNG